jgi:tetraacyldisaccharide 4'-kinase
VTKLVNLLQRLWAGERGSGPAALGIIARPGAAAFSSVVRVRNSLYDARILPTSSAHIPVISVGNLAVGGTGKTPITAWLVRELLSRSWLPAIVTRGYGEDEVLLHRRWNPDVPVIVSKRRFGGVQEAQAMGRNIAVIDDGFQHRQLKRDVDVVLLSPAHPLPAKLLPRGPFREPLRSLRRAHLVLVTAKGTHELARAQALMVELRRLLGSLSIEVFAFSTGPWQMLDGQPRPPPPGGALVLCSIGEPKGFQRNVEVTSGESTELLALRDHHVYTEIEVRRISHRAGPRWIATTEKDAVKLAPFRELLTNVRVLPLVPTVPETLVDRVVQPLGTLEAPRRLG